MRLTPEARPEDGQGGSAGAGPSGSGDAESGAHAASGLTMKDRLTGLLVLEFIAVLIALAAPLTPSKTGSTWTPAEVFTPDPGYPREALAVFVTVNLILLVLGVLVWVTVMVRGGTR